MTDQSQRKQAPPLEHDNVLASALALGAALINMDGQPEDVRKEIIGKGLDMFRVLVAADVLEKIVEGDDGEKFRLLKQTTPEARKILQDHVSGALECLHELRSARLTDFIKAASKVPGNLDVRVMTTEQVDEVRQKIVNNEEVPQEMRELFSELIDGNKSNNGKTLFAVPGTDAIN